MEGKKRREREYERKDRKKEGNLREEGRVKGYEERDKRKEAKNTRGHK